MIGYLKGIVMEKDEKSILILVNNLGFSLFMPEKELAFVKIGSENEFYTEMVVRENELTLYGFLTREDKAFFNLLNEVSGIGPKTSINILSAIDGSSLSKAILSEDMTILTKLPGIGKKTAQRIILDIKDKLAKREDLHNFAAGKDFALPLANENTSLVFDTLEALGYSSKEILSVMPQLENNENLSEEAMIKAALKILSVR